MELEASIRDVAGEIDAARPRESLHPLRGLDERLTARLAEDGELRAAMFRFVDVAPACDSRRELGRHLTEHLEHVERPPVPVRTALRIGRSAFALPVLGAAAKIAVERTAHRFIVGRSPIDALPVLRGLWKRGVGSSLAHESGRIQSHSAHHVKTSPNKSDAPNPTMASVFHVGRLGRGVGDPKR